MSSSPARRLFLLAAALLVLCALFLHHEVLLGGRVYHMDDAADGYYPSHVALFRAFATGELPTWERGAWCGFPLLADPYYGAFYPLSVTFLLSAVRGLGASIFLHTALAALGMLLLLRRRGLSPGPSLLGAAGLGLSTFMVERIRHIIFPQMMAWVPFALLFVEGYLQTGRRRELVLLAGSLGLLLICGALPLLPFVALCLLSYVLPRALLAAPRRLPALFLAAGCGLLLSMAQVVPTLAHLPESPRQLGVDYALASTYAWPDLRYLLLLLLPDFFGGALRGQWLGAYNHWELAGWYVGLWPVLLLPLGLLRRRGRPELLGLLFVALLAVALAFGDAAPVHGWFFRHVPLYAALRCPARALVMFLIAAPLLGAEGLEWLLGRIGPQGGDGPAASRRIAAAGVALSLVVLGGALWLRWPVPRLAPLAVAMRLALGHGLLVLGLGLALLFSLLRGLLPRSVVGLLLGVLTLGDLLAVARAYVQPQPADFAAGTERFAAVDWLLARSRSPGTGGAAGALPDRFAIDPKGPFRLHNLGLTYGIEGVGGYDSYSIWRYVQYLHVLNSGAPYPYRQLRHDPAAGDVRNFRSPLLDLLNVRWYIGRAAPAPGWIERFRPAPGAPLHARYEPVWDPHLGVYENPEVLPRAFVVYRARVVTGAAAQAQALATLDPRREALLEEPPSPALEGGAAPRALTPARLLLAERQRLVIEAEAAAPGILVVSEAHYPGWTATMDGQPAPLLRADYALRGVVLPAGRHQVELRFVSRPARLGLLLSALGLLGLPLLGLLGRHRRNR